MKTDLKTPQDVMKFYGVKTYRETKDGLIAIHKRSLHCWYYFRFNGLFYMLTGSTERFDKADDYIG